MKVEVRMWFPLFGQSRTPGLDGVPAGEYRTYLFVLDVWSDWEIDEVWWIDSPISALDPQGVLVLEHISEGRWFLRGYGDDASDHDAYLFYGDHEDELQDAVNEYQQANRKHDYDPEALVELYGV